MAPYRFARRAGEVSRDSFVDRAVELAFDCSSGADTSDEVQSLRFGDGCKYGFTLRDENGSIIAPPPPICTMDTPVVDYQPRQSVTIKRSWVWDDASIEPGI